MKVLITGAGGFVGKNLKAHLKYTRPEVEVLSCTRDTSMEELGSFCREADAVVHLAGVNRPKEEGEFKTGNADFTGQLVELLEKAENKAPVIYASSIQATLDNPYGKSKKEAEDLIFALEERCGNKAYVYRFTNLFGKWCRPNYNSVVATFCSNIANDLEITVNNEDAVLTLTYIDDLLEEVCRALDGNPTWDDVETAKAGEGVAAADEAAAAQAETKRFCRVPVTDQITLGQLAELLKSFKEMPRDLQVPDMESPLARKLFATYLSYLPEESFKYELKMNQDNRGSFTEIIRTPDRGQFSVNISKPGITKGQHWHHTKNEKFLVVSGKGRIELRKIDSDEVIAFEVSGEKLEVVQMIPGYTHNIINMSETEDLITFMWADEAFNPDRPDTYFEPV